MDAANLPVWLNGLAMGALGLGLACAALIALDETRRPRPMWMVNLVWPLTALFGSLLWLLFYLHVGGADGHPDSLMLAVAVGANHCGAGCTVGDSIAEWATYCFPGLAKVFGWGLIAGDRMFAVWGLDFALAFIAGVAFQFFSLDPAAPPRERTVRALSAGAASIVAWQVGTYAFMAFAQLVWLPRAFGGEAPVDRPEFWFAMQAAMLFGFVFSYPVNWALIRVGVKQRA